MSSSDGMVKILFEATATSDRGWHDQTESMWATPIVTPDAPEGYTYRLENSPWYAFSISFQDDVVAETRTDTFEKDGGSVSYRNRYFTQVWKHNGHSTYLVSLDQGITTESEQWLAPWQRLKELGCTYEGMNGQLLAIDVEPGNDLDAVEAILEEASSYEFQVQHRYTPEIMH